VYSLGATYFALLTGKPPYPGDLQVQVMYAHCSSPVPDPRELDERIPEKVAAIARKAMAKLPEERFRNAADMLAALDAILASVAKSRRPQPSQWTLAIKAHRDHSPGDKAKATHGPRRKVRKELVAAAVVFLIAFSLGLVGFLMRPTKPPATVENSEQKADPWDDLDEILAGLDAKIADGATKEPNAEGKPSVTAEGRSSSLLTSLGDPITLPGVATALGVAVKDSRVAIACQPGTGHDVVCLWESQTGKLTEVTTADIPFGVTSQNNARPRRVRAMAFHFRTGQLIAAVHDGEAAGVAALSFGPAPRWETWFPLPAHQVGSLAISRDGVRLAAAMKKAAGQPDCVAVWNWQEQKLIDEISDVSAVTALAFSPAPSGSLAIGRSTGSVTVVDGAAKTSRSFETGAGVRSLSFASGGNFLGVAGGRKLVIYSLGRKQSMPFPTQGDAQSLALFPGGSFLIGGVETAGRGTIEVFRMPNPNSVERLDAHDGPITLTAFTPDGVLFTAGRLFLSQGRNWPAHDFLGQFAKAPGCFTRSHFLERLSDDSPSACPRKAEGMPPAES
jgi:WD40 repeat protein